jgi:hypothetical protein
LSQFDLRRNVLALDHEGQPGRHAQRQRPDLLGRIQGRLQAMPWRPGYRRFRHSSQLAGQSDSAPFDIRASLRPFASAQQRLDA